MRRITGASIRASSPLLFPATSGRSALLGAASSLNCAPHRSLYVSGVLHAKASSAEAASKPAKASKPVKEPKVKKVKANADTLPAGDVKETKAEKKAEKKEEKVKEEKVKKVKKVKETKPKKTGGAADQTTSDEVARFMDGLGDEQERDSALRAGLEKLRQDDEMQLKGFVDALEQLSKTRSANKRWGAFKIQDDGQVLPLGAYRSEEEAQLAHGGDEGQEELVPKQKKEKKAKKGSAASGDDADKSRKEKRDEKKIKEKAKKEEKAKKAEDKKLAKVAAKATKTAGKAKSKASKAASTKEEELK